MTKTVSPVKPMTQLSPYQDMNTSGLAPDLTESAAINFSPVGTYKARMAAAPSLSIQTVSAAGANTAKDWDSVIYVDATAGAVTLALPSTLRKKGTNIRVIKTDATNNVVNIKSSLGTLNGVAAGTTAIVLTGQLQEADITNDGTNQTGVVSKKSGRTVVNLSADGAVASWNSLVLVDATAAAVAVTLPAPAGNAGEDIVVVKIDSGTNHVNLKSASGTLNGTAAGSTGASITTQYGKSTVTNNGTNQFAA